MDLFKEQLLARIAQAKKQSEHYRERLTTIPTTGDDAFYLRQEIEHDLEDLTKELTKQTNLFSLYYKERH